MDPFFVDMNPFLVDTGPFPGGMDPVIDALLSALRPARSDPAVGHSRGHVTNRFFITADPQQVRLART